jgi:chemotaxis signal transduction protein
MNLGTRGALTFRLGDYCFAVRVEEAGGVLDAERLAQLPGVADPVAGVAAFRGEMVPVVDLASYLGIDAPMGPGHRYALVLYRGMDRFALLVPEIPRLIPGRDLREAPPAAPDPEMADLFESVLENDQEHFHCLNYWRIFETIIPPVGPREVVPPRNGGTSRCQ